jgi:hypothetical protein
MNELVGSHKWLAKMPVWAIALVGLAILMVIPFGRYFFEGMMYDISFASSVGDKALLVVVLIGATMLQRGVRIPKWLQSDRIHLMLCSLCFASGLIICISTLSSRQGREMDAWHDIIVVPLFAYLAFTLLPVIFSRENGKFVNVTMTELAVVVCCIFVWVGLGWFDASQGLLIQRAWLSQHTHLIWMMRY